MEIESEVLIRFTRSINLRLGKYHRSPNRNAWNKLHLLIQSMMSVPLKKEIFKWAFIVYDIIPDELKAVDDEFKTHVLRLRLSGDWATYIRIYEMENHFTREEVGKIRDVLFAWYIFDKWVTNKIDLCEIK